MADSFHSTRILHCRKVLGLSQRRLARLARISQPSLSLFESGESTAISALTVKHVEAALMREAERQKYVASNVLFTLREEQLQSWWSAGSIAPMGDLLHG